MYHAGVAAPNGKFTAPQTTPQLARTLHRSGNIQTYDTSDSSFDLIKNSAVSAKVKAHPVLPDLIHSFT